MQVTFIGVVVCLVLSVAQLVLVQDLERGSCYGNQTIEWVEDALSAADEAQLLEQAAMILDTEEDTRLKGKAAVANIEAGQCLPEKRFTLIYRYLIIYRRRVCCYARISLSNCLGYCRSYQSVNPYNGYVSNYCACCQAVRHQTVTQNVTLYCPELCNYVNYRHTFIQPAQCSCRSC